MDKQYQQQGYRHFREAVPAEAAGSLGELAYRMITPYRGELRRQSGRYEFNQFFPSSMLISNALGNGHLGLPDELRPVYDALRALIASPGIFQALHRLDGAKHYTIHQTIIFFASPSTGAHIDSFSLDTAPHGFAHTIWMPLEDMDHLSGVPAVVPWPIGKLLTEQELELIDTPISYRERHDRYCYALAAYLQRTGAQVQTTYMRKGDFLVWGSLTPHFSFPSTPPVRRRLALQVLVRPTHLRWGHFERQPTEWTADPAERINDRFSFFLKDD